MGRGQEQCWEDRLYTLEEFEHLRFTTKFTAKIWLKMSRPRNLKGTLMFPGHGGTIMHA